MKCPQCKQDMRKVRWEITNNGQTGKDLKEYGRETYQCIADDVWVNTEIPLADEKKAATN